MGAKLAETVYVRRPGTTETVRLDAGSEPPAELAALVTTPSAWEGGKLPSAATDSKSSKTSAKDSGDGNDGDTSADTKPARKTAARKTAAS